MPFRRSRLHIAWWVPVAFMITAAIALVPRRAHAQCSNANTSLTPCGGTLTDSVGKTNQTQVFAIHNLSSRAASISISATCTGYVISCSVSPSDPNVPAMSSTNVTVTYSVASTRSSGTLSLNATVAALVSTLTVSPPPHAAHEASVLSLPYYNTDNRQAALCAMNCFDKILSYSTPSYYTEDVPRIVTLLYRSSSANPMVTVQVSANDSSSNTPWKISLRVHRPTGAFVNFTNGTSELFFKDSVANTTARVAGQFTPVAPDTLTGAYTYTAVVTKYWADGTVQHDSTPVRILLENERSSVIGAGWTVVGQQAIYPQSDGSVVITDGTGSIGYFKVTVPNCIYNCTYTSPAGDYSVLTTRDSLSSAPLYTRRFPDGTRFQFHVNGTLFQVHDRNERVTFYYYNSLWQDSAIVDPTGKAMHFAYGPADGWKVGAIRKLSDDFGRDTWFGVDTLNNLAQIEDPLGNQYGGITLAVNARYNAQHQLISNIDRHQATWHFAYDFAGKLRADSTPSVLADGSTQSLVTRYQSQDSSMLINPSSSFGSSTNPAAFELSAPWWAAMNDPEGNNTSWTNDRWGQALTLNDAGGGTTLYSRNGAGQPISIKYPWGGTDLFRYDTLGRRVWSQPAGRDSTTYKYGNNYAIADTITGPHQPSTVLTLNSTGNVTTMKIANTYTTTFAYDSLGRDTITVDPVGHQTKYHYDATFGNLDSTLAPGNRFTKLTFDTYGRLYSSAANNIQPEFTWYDGLNRVIKVYGGAQADTTRLAYDSMYLVRVQDAKGQVYKTVVNALGWPTRTDDPADTVNRYESYSYNKVGGVTGYTNRRGQSITMAYDGLHRLTSKKGTGIDSATYSYSANRRVSVGANAISIDTIFTDSLGWTNAISTTFLRGGSHTFHTRYFPTSLHQLDSVDVITSGSSIVFAGRKFVWDSTTSLLTAMRIASQPIVFGYNSEAFLTSVQYNSWVKRTDSRLANHRLYQTQFTAGTTSDTVVNPALSRKYYFDGIDRITQMNVPGVAQTETFVYDSLNRFSQEKDYTSATCAAVDTTYGVNCASGTLTSAPLEQYDAVGNLVASGTGTLTYGTGNRIQTAGSTQYTTDADGDVVRRFDSTHDIRYGWSADGLLTSDTVAGPGTVVQYDYNAFGRLVHQKLDTTERYFLWDQSSDQLLAEIDTSMHRVAEYAYSGSDAPVAIVTGSTAISAVRYVQEDGMGNVIGVFTSQTSTTSSIAQLVSYSPFGEMASSGTLADTNRLRWRGLMWEGDSTQLYYARGRWYDPQLGRFMSEDPIGLGGGINEYTFADGDYVNGSDPSGLDGDGGGCADGTHGEEREGEDCGGGDGDGGGDPPAQPIATVHITAPAPPPPPPPSYPPYPIPTRGPEPLGGGAGGGHGGGVGGGSGGDASGSSSGNSAQQHNCYSGPLTYPAVRNTATQVWNETTTTEQGAYLVGSGMGELTPVPVPSGGQAQISMGIPPFGARYFIHSHPNAGSAGLDAAGQPAIWDPGLSRKDITLSDALGINFVAVTADSLYYHNPRTGQNTSCGR